MFTTDSTTKQRPAKPAPEFPLYAHKSGRWAKKINGKTHFFGPSHDPDGLSRYLAEKAIWRVGRSPHEKSRPSWSLVRPRRVVPPSPTLTFPSTRHKSGRWAKKIRGKTHSSDPGAIPMAHSAATTWKRMTWKLDGRRGGKSRRH